MIDPPLTKEIQKCWTVCLKDVEYLEFTFSFLTTSPASYPMLCCLIKKKKMPETFACSNHVASSCFYPLRSQQNHTEEITTAALEPTTFKRAKS